MFKRFQSQWPYFDQGRYGDTFSAEFAISELVNVRHELVAFSEQQLQDYQPRDDYRELLELMLIFLGRTHPHGAKFRAPGPIHQARWMVKAIYSLKVWLFRSQFQLTTKETRRLRDFNRFPVTVYVKAWFMAPLAHTASRNDLQLVQQLHAYTQRNISAATSRKIVGHLWYLSQDLILLSLVDPELNSTMKRAIVKATTEKDGEDDPPKQLVLDLATVNRRLVDFVSNRSRNVFTTLGMPYGLLDEYPDTWNERDDYKAAHAIVHSLATTNDHAERGVALIQEATRSGCFRNEEQLQHAVQVVEQSRANFPDAKRSILLMKKP